MITFTPGFIPNTIIIYGIGGTGSRLVPLIAQFVKTCPWIINPLIYLVDFDIVEEKNLLRQNFISKDVGQNKAVVSANRYSRAFDVNIFPITSRITEDNFQTSWPTADWGDIYRNALHILCVDSPEARREIVAQIKEGATSTHSLTRNDLLIIDSGNESDFGQVKLSGLLELEGKAGKRIGNIPSNYPLNLELYSFPMDKDYFEGMVAETKISCADLDQTMAINCLMATTIFSVVQNIYYCKPIPFHRLNTSLLHGTTPEYITTGYLGSICNEKFNRANLASRTLDGILVPIEEDILSPECFKNYHAFSEAMKGIVSNKVTPKEIIPVQEPPVIQAGEDVNQDFGIDGVDWDLEEYIEDVEEAA